MAWMAVQSGMQNHSSSRTTYTAAAAVAAAGSWFYKGNYLLTTSRMQFFPAARAHNRLHSLPSPRAKTRHKSHCGNIIPHSHNIAIDRQANFVTPSKLVFSRQHPTFYAKMTAIKPTCRKWNKNSSHAVALLISLRRNITNINTMHHTLNIHYHFLTLFNAQKTLPISPLTIIRYSNRLLTLADIFRNAWSGKSLHFTLTSLLTTFLRGLLSSFLTAPPIIGYSVPIMATK
jgi:hypothetical protein